MNDLLHSCKGLLDAVQGTAKRLKITIKATKNAEGKTH